MHYEMVINIHQICDYATILSTPIDNVLIHPLRHQVYEVTATVLHLARVHVETQSPDIEVFLHISWPCLSWLFHLYLPLRCPSDSCSGDGVGGHSADMS